MRSSVHLPELGEYADDTRTRWRVDELRTAWIAAQDTGLDYPEFEAELLIEWARELWALGDGLRALGVMRFVCEMRHEHADARLIYTEMACVLRMPREAFWSCMEHLARHEDDPYGWLLLARIEFLSGDTPAARRALSTALQHAPRDARAQQHPAHHLLVELAVQIAAFHRVNGDPQQAIALLNELLGPRTDDCAVARERGLALFASGAQDEACEVLRVAVRRHRDSAPLRDTYAAVLAGSGRLRAAISQRERALSRNHWCELASSARVAELHLWRVQLAQERGRDEQTDALAGLYAHLDAAAALLGVSVHPPRDSSGPSVTQTCPRATLFARRELATSLEGIATSLRQLGLAASAQIVEAHPCAWQPLSSPTMDTERALTRVVTLVDSELM